MKRIPQDLILPIGLAVALLLLEFTVGIGPRWPNGPAVTISTMVLIGLSPVVARSLFSDERRTTRVGEQKSTLVLRTGLAALSLFIIYLVLDSSLCYPLRDYRDRVVGGFTLRPEIVPLVFPPPSADYLPTPLSDLLRDADKNPLRIWTNWSVAAARGILLTDWLVAWIAAVVCVSLSQLPTPVLQPGVRFADYVGALNAAYDRQSLEEMVERTLHRDLKRFRDIQSYNGFLREVLRAAEKEGWHQDLIFAAYRNQPTNDRLARIYDTYGYGVDVEFQRAGLMEPAAQTSATAPGFERTVRRQIPMVDMVGWREKIAAIEGRICRIESSGSALGTGFLVAADLVMTNYHVVECVVNGKVHPSKITCRFDYKCLADGSRQNGREVQLAENWKIDLSRYSAAEKKCLPDESLPAADELDYALIRLAEAVGSQPIGAVDGKDGPSRGWVATSGTFPALVPDTPLAIAQHPDGAPLKFAIDTQAVISENANGTRVRYNVNTEAGSSGSPCFTLDWELVALHHYGDPAYGHPKWNQGVPFAAIWKRVGPEGGKFLSPI